MPKGYQSSGLMTANSLIKSTSGRLGGVQVIGSATNEAVTIIGYDTNAASAAGTELFKAQLDAAEVKDYVNVPLPDVIFQLGCYVAMTNGNYVVHFS